MLTLRVLEVGTENPQMIERRRDSLKFIMNHLPLQPSRRHLAVLYLPVPVRSIYIYQTPSATRNGRVNVLGRRRSIVLLRPLTESNKRRLAIIAFAGIYDCAGQLF